MSTHLLRITHGVGLSANAVREALADADSLMAGVQLDRFLFNETSSSVFNYRVWLVGGRQWRQVLTFTGAFDADPDMTFDVQPGWRLSEFTAQRAWRLACISLRNAVQATVIRLDPN